MNNSVLVISKGNLDNSGDFRRFYDALAVMKGLEAVHPDKVKVLNGKYFAMISAPEGDGDPYII